MNISMPDSNKASNTNSTCLTSIFPKGNFRGKQSIFFNMMDSIVHQNKITPKNIRTFDFAKLARKSNSTNLLKKTEIPVFGLHIYKAYRKIFKLGQNSEKWEPQDDENLKKAVELHGSTNFTNVALRVEGKKVMECYYRWFKHNNPFRSV